MIHKRPRLPKYIYTGHWLVILRWFEIYNFLIYVGLRYVSIVDSFTRDEWVWSAYKTSIWLLQAYSQHENRLPFKIILAACISVPCGWSAKICASLAFSSSKHIHFLYMHIHKNPWIIDLHSSYSFFLVFYMVVLWLLFKLECYHPHWLSAISVCWSDDSEEAAAYKTLKIEYMKYTQDFLTISKIASLVSALEDSYPVRYCRIPNSLMSLCELVYIYLHL